MSNSMAWTEQQEMAALHETHSEITAVFVDMDGVVCDLVATVCARTGKQLPDDYPRGEYDVYLPLGLRERDFWNALKPYAPTFEKLPRTPEAYDIAGLLRRHSEITGGLYGSRVVLLTKAPQWAPPVWQGKAAWAGRFMPHTEVMVVSSDKNLLAAPGRLLIDDCDANVEGWRRAGGEAITVPRPWNTGSGDALAELEARLLAARSDRYDRVRELLTRCNMGNTGDGNERV